MRKKYQINLNESQRQELINLVKNGSAKAREIRRVHRLLMAADGKTDQTIAETLQISVAIERTRKQLCCENLAATLKEKERPGKPRKLTNFAVSERIGRYPLSRCSCNFIGNG
ncbi:hypothetical protein [Nostoc sp.]|uniref:hypothetical protein n=1 Tax=Nostoc sp. TaxID=1180 RepID=UPI002FF4F451